MGDGEIWHDENSNAAKEDLPFKAVLFIIKEKTVHNSKECSL